MTAIIGATPAARSEIIANQLRTVQRVNLPHMAYWNYDACEHHETPIPDCQYRACGGDLFDHQTVAASWLVFRCNGLVASSPGTGKTNVALATTALLKEADLLNRPTVFVVNTPAVSQWLTEARRFTKMKAEAILPGTPRKARIATYSASWDILIVGNHMMVQDHEILKKISPGFLLSDDVDALLNPKNRTHKIFSELAESASRVVVMSASALQTSLTQLHSAMVPIGGKYIWGSLRMFENKYLKREWDEVRIRPKKGQKFGPNDRRTVKIAHVVGLQNGDELRERLAPWVIRHTYEDLGNDLRMPELMPPTEVWLELHPEQRAKYEELRNGVLTIQRAEGEQVKQVQALQMFTHGAQICAGLSALGEPDGPGKSVKLDWVEKQLQTVWQGEKVVVFAKNLGTISALQNRLTAQGIGYATIWGKDSDPEARAAEVTRFWEDPNCRVFMGTSAIERSLNLQVANIVVNIDLHLNPERVKQLLGRVRRAGSAHSHIYVFTLLANDTQESSYLDVLRKREAVTSFVWEDDETVFERLSPADMLRLITR